MADAVTDAGPHSEVEEEDTSQAAAVLVDAAYLCSVLMGRGASDDFCSATEGDTSINGGTAGGGARPTNK